MIQLPTLYVAAHENVYGSALFSCFGKMPFKKCHLPLPPPFTHLIREDPDPEQPSHLTRLSLVSELSFTGFPSFHCLCHGHQTNSSICCFSPICSRLSFPASFVFASSSTLCCHTSGFEHGPTSWIWSLAAVCCQCFPTEDRDGIQKARGNGGQAGNSHSRWRLRQANLYRSNVLIPSFHCSMSVWLFSMSFLSTSLLFLKMQTASSASFTSECSLSGYRLVQQVVLPTWITGGTSQ